MSKKIMGVTVGTPTSPKKIEKEIKPIKTVNGIEPDANGNVNIDGGSAELPIFDLVALGAKPIEIGKGQTLNVDTTEIMAALDKGLVTFELEIVRDSGTFRYYVTPIMQRTGAFYHCYYINKGTGIIETISVVVTTGMMIVGASQDAIGGNDITVDSELSLESENPVQNKVVTQEFRAFNEVAGAFNERLSTLEKGGVGGEEYEIPTFNLVELGLPTIIPNGQYVRVATDTAEIIAALEKGAVKIIVNFNMGAEVAVSLVLNPASVIAAGEYSCTATSEFNGIMLITTVGVGDGYIAAKCTPMDNIIGAYIDAALGGDY